MNKNKIEYLEISKAKVAKKRNAVISKCSKGGYTIAQQLETEEDGKTISVFLKGAIHVEDRKGLLALRDAINFVLNNEDVDWDE